MPVVCFLGFQANSNSNSRRKRAFEDTTRSFINCSGCGRKNVFVPDTKMISDELSHPTLLQAVHVSTPDISIDISISVLNLILYGISSVIFCKTCENFQLHEIQIHGENIVTHGVKITTKFCNVHVTHPHRYRLQRAQ